MQIKMGDRYETVRFFHCYKRGVDRVFIDHPLFLERVRFNSIPSVVEHGRHPLVAVSVSFFPSGRWFQVWGKTEEKIYGPDAGTDYKDNQLRFSLLCQVRTPFHCTCTSEFRSSHLSAVYAAIDSLTLCWILG